MSTCKQSSAAAKGLKFPYSRKVPWPGSGPHVPCSHAIGQNLVTWSYLTERDAGKCSLAMRPASNLSTGRGEQSWVGSWQSMPCDDRTYLQVYDEN